MKKEQTERGFDIYRFKDRYDCDCSLQKSSIATEDCIWLGVEDANPKIMASKAKQHGIETDKTTGWIKYPIHEDVMLNTNMHLSIEQVKELLPILINFVNTGEI